MADLLVVASKIKKHVKETYGLRTSQEALEALSTLVLEECAEAHKQATADGRKTIQARDFVHEGVNEPGHTFEPAAMPDPPPSLDEGGDPLAAALSQAK